MQSIGRPQLDKTPAEVKKNSRPRDASDKVDQGPGQEDASGIWRLADLGPSWTNRVDLEKFEAKVNGGFGG